MDVREAMFKARLEPPCIAERIVLAVEGSERGFPVTAGKTGCVGGREGGDGSGLFLG